MKSFALICLFSLLSFSGKTQLTSSPHHFGLHAGFTTGLGLSYRYWPKKIGVQLTAAPQFSKNYFNIYSGLTGLLSIKKNATSEFFTYLGASLNSTKDDYYVYENGTYYQNLKVDNKLNIGLGIGFRVTFLKVFDVNFQGGYGVYDITKNIRSRPTGEIGLYYRY
ncbi:hypothetical protein DNU06_05215 [Putridiphycobacter roseus]|uniref:Outer membrane protein beta-barrel domain-containing protein n=1 Tax=Putridiphycobacter roseus TaxID=2219161 RepID=A0A2W1NTH4_9FLAO|nr:hypothetical protein [Putridiphycobacter roseus]PZE18018.1 hypothetical protein DNU06_05215 [Putridiphycobacter roseus]